MASSVKLMVLSLSKPISIPTNQSILTLFHWKYRNANCWVIPHTEIALVRVLNGPRTGEFLFSPETVARVNDDYERVRLLAYTHPVPMEYWRDILVNGGGWLIPHAWLQSSPAWLRTPLAGQAVWKWIALFLMLGVFMALLRWVYRLSRLGSDERPFLQALAQSTLPGFLLIAAPAIAYLALVQINLIGSVAIAVELVTTAILFWPGPGLPGESRRWSPKPSSPRPKSPRKHRCPPHSDQRACWGSWVGPGCWW